MTRRLKLSEVLDDKPVRLTVDLPADVHRDLVDYARAFAEDTGRAVEPVKLVAPMLARFMASDRGFVRGRKRSGAHRPPGEAQSR